MSHRPALVRNVPFWGIVAVSAATAAAGAAILTDKLGTMTTTLTDGSATGVDVYVGQAVAVLGAVLLGAGILGIILALVVAAIASLRPSASVAVIETIDWSADDDTDQDVVAGTDASTSVAAAPLVETEKSEVAAR